MKKTTKIVIIALLAAVLLLGVGYAAIQNITLNIAGTAAADPSQSNFKVMFTGTPEVSDSTYVTAGITDDTNATINVSGLTTKGQVVTATYIVQNVSTDLSADLGVATTNNNTEYFTVSSELAKTSLVAGEATTVTVTVELTKTPIQEPVSSIVGVQITAAPVQPGEEGTSDIVNDYSQTPEVPTLASVTNDNIGDYIDLGNNIVGTESTTDDWRILYKDGNTVYAILAYYLPASQVPASAGLTTRTANYPYGVWLDTDSDPVTDRDTFLNGLKNTRAWSTFANGIEGAQVTGSPTGELLISSYNAKNGTEYGTELVYQNTPKMSGDLYVPHTEEIDQCNGYWLASPGIYGMWFVDIWCNIDCDGIGPYIGVRPVVSLPSDTVAELVDGVWVVE